MAYRRALVIMNPVSGQHDPKRTRRRLEERFREGGLDFDFRETQGDGDALCWAEAAGDEGFDVVVAVGGDGTIMEAMSGLIKSKGSVPLAQVPTGTANLLARALLIPINVEKSLELVFSGKEERLDVGYLPDHDRYFALVAGMGYDANMIAEAPRNLKRVMGFAAYVVSGIKSLFRLKRVRVHLEADGEKMDFLAHTVMVINVGQIAAAKISLGPDIHPHDGKLDLMIASSVTLWGLARTFWQILTRQYKSQENLRYIQAAKIKIEVQPPLGVQIDGEAFGTTPLCVEAVPGGANLIVPQEYVAEQEARSEGG
ncbi:MAG: diacylglycerol kinase family lipid kinase [Deinococcota bacterium]|jgi:YegS/Rv2252/BmrU family lipid kinase|nr:diacylglycerol kinase family lipid kinase [Deinococcota bacterium]